MLVFRQQIKLLKMLAEFEQVEETQKEIDQLNISEDDQHKFMRQQKNKRKLETLPVAFPEKTMTETIEPTNPLGSVDITLRKREPSVHIKFNFYSNWGSKDFIGLTEVCFIIYCLTDQFFITFHKCKFVIPSCILFPGTTFQRQ